MKQLYAKLTAVAAILFISTCIANAQPTGSRLIAQAKYFNNVTVLTPLDSHMYIYPNTNTELYNQKMSYQNTTSGFVHLRKQDFTYNTAGKLTYMEFQNWNTSTNAYINGGMTWFTLNSAGFCTYDSNMLWIPANNAYRKNVINTYILNSAGQVLDKVYKSWDFSLNNVINTFRTVNTYNPQGNMLVSLHQEWDASLHWVDDTRATYAYDATGTELQTVTGEQAVTFASPLQLIYQNVLTLNPDGTTAVCLSNMWNATTAAYKPSMKLTYTYDANGNNITEIWEQWDVPTSAYKPYLKYVRTYNNYNQKTTDIRHQWDGTGYNTVTDRDNYWYETYNAPTSVGNTKLDVNLSLAPMPFTGDLHIAINWDEPQAFTAVITDMNGRMCHTFNAPATKQYVIDVNLANLPAGNYVFTIRGEHGGSTSRLITLQH